MSTYIVNRFCFFEVNYSMPVINKIRYYLFIVFITIAPSTMAMPNLNVIELSGTLLYQVKTNAPTNSVENALANLPMDSLATALNNDDARKTFWINIYNAYFQILAIRQHKTTPAIFTQKLITIAGTNFSLDNIEHGILRHYRWKLSLGYLSQAYPSKIIKRLSVSKIDYRIHFALNCGAKSCPPIAFYNYANINRQLELATTAFLTSETEIDATNKTVHVSKIMQWFKADFGGKKGTLKILSQYLKQNFTGYTITYKAYSWNEKLRNYQPF